MEHEEKAGENIMATIPIDYCSEKNEVYLCGDIAKLKSNM